MSASPDTAEVDSAALKTITAGTARIAAAAGLRQILSTGMLAVTAAVVARCLGPHDFGVYSGGTAGYTLAVSFTDLGFSIYLAREMSQSPEAESRLMGTALPALALWTWVPTLLLAVLAVCAGGDRGAVMAVLTPGVLLGGLVISRQIFTVRFVATPLVILDLSTTLLQCGIMIALALAHVSLILLAVNLCFWSGVVNLIALVLARRQVTFVKPQPREVMRFIANALPMGAALILTSLYFTIDMTLLGWLVTPAELGNYAAAVRLLSVVVMIPGLIMAAGVPGLSRTSSDKTTLSGFAGTLAHWIAITAVPVGVGFAVFANPVVHIMFGGAYQQAVPLVRILMLAGGLTFVSNLTGMILMTQGIIGPQILFNALSLAVNVAGNLVLVHAHGVVVSAWLTVVSETIVATYGLIVLRSRVDYRRVLAQTWRPLVAVGIAAAVGLLLGASSGVSVACASLAFLGAMTLSRAWPGPVNQWLAQRLRSTP